MREQRAREDELRKRDELLSHIAESVSDVVWITTADKGEIEFVSEAYEDIWGRPCEELYENPNSFIEAVHPEDRERVREALVRQQVDPDSYDETYRVVQPDGEVRYVNDRAFGVYEDGELQRIVGVVQDITERREAQRQLEAEHDMFAQGPAVVFRWRNEEGWPVEYVSENVADLLGYTPDQLTSGEIPYANLVHEDDIERVAREVAENSDGTTDRFTHEPYRLVTADGDVVWVKDATKIVREDGEITEYRGYLVDITERKQREEELRQLKEEYELMVDTVGDVVYTLSDDYVFMSVNGAAEDVTGYTCDELEGEHISMLLSEDDIEVADEYRQEVISGELETGSIDLSVNRKDGSACPVEFRYRLLPAESGEFIGTAGVMRDITDRKRREEKIATQRDELARLDRINGIIRDIDQALVGANTRAEIEQAVCDRLTDAGRYKFALALRLRGDDEFVPHAWTDTAEQFLDEVFPAEELHPQESPALRALERDEVQVVQSLENLTTDVYWHENLLNAGIESLVAIPVTYQGTEYGVIVVYGEEEHAFGDRELDVLGELGETVGYAIAAVERREREQMLTVLYEATQELLGAESTQEVSEVVVSTAAEVLGPPGIGIFLFDDETNVLRPVAATDELISYYGGVSVFGPGRTESVVWQSYVTGESQFYDDVRESEFSVNPDTDARSVLVVPLGDHGVFVTSSPEISGFDERKRQLVGLLAATTEAALDRVAGRIGIRERDRELAARTERLERIERVLDCLRDVDQLLIEAGTRNEIERGICERLTEMEPYDFAWVGTVPPDSDTVEPRTWVGNEGGYLDAVTLDVDGREPVSQTAASGKPTFVPNTTDHLHETAWARAAVDRDFQSVAAVPLVFGETSYGILAVYANQPDAFANPVGEVLEELGRISAYSINSVETRRGILAERMTELELRIEEPETFLNAVAAVADEPVSYREILPDEGGTAHVLFGLNDPPVDEILALEDEFVSVESLSHTTADGEHLFRATLGGQTVAATLLKCGGLPHEVVASPDETHVVVRLPQELDVRVFLDRVRESYPDSSLVSRRDIERQSQPGTDVYATLEANLTDRQREVLLTAYRTGFFESPRETTGAELAALLDISQPTLTHHLREAQRRLFEAIYSQDA
jgi:PAS domain S-box-containing protein